MDSDNLKVVIRPGEPNDKSFIMSSWLKGNYYGNSYFGLMPPGLYYKHYADYITEILIHPESRIDVACDEKSPSWVVGFIVYSGPTLYWAYTKVDYRGKGIARLLTKNKSFSVVTSTTKCGQAIIKKMGLIFNPMKAGTNGK